MGVGEGVMTFLCSLRSWGFQFRYFMGSIFHPKENYDRGTRHESDCWSRPRCFVYTTAVGLDGANGFAEPRQNVESASTYVLGGCFIRCLDFGG